MRTIAVVLASLLLAACATPQPAASSADRFFANLRTLCGKTFTGSLVSPPVPADADFAGKPLAARAGPCTGDEVRIAFDVGADRSRTWIVTRTPAGLRLKHRHLLKDGSEDPVSRYGGHTVGPGTAARQEFPADAFSKATFTRRSMTVSLPNVWAMEVEPNRGFTYELARPERLFRVQFKMEARARG